MSDTYDGGRPLGVTLLSVLALLLLGIVNSGRAKSYFLAR